MKITFISDTHARHRRLDLPVGDLLIHAGDIMTSGYNSYELQDFCRWFDAQYYDVCAFIAGNHDRFIENEPEKAMEIINSYDVDYMQDGGFEYGDYPDEMVKVYGSPWQPEFYSWAFNLPRNGEELAKVWNDIPEDIGILVTHGPPFGHLDTIGPQSTNNLGCELLRARVDEIKPKIHVFGHIHGGYGYKFHNGTHFINASVLNESYEYRNKPITIDWDPETNELEFV